MDYKNEKLLKVFSDSITKHHTLLQMNEVVGSLKAMAHFDYLDIPARDGLVKTAIRNSQEYSFKGLASICESLAMLRHENKTILEIVRRQLLMFESRDSLNMLIDQAAGV